MNSALKAFKEEKDINILLFLFFYPQIFYYLSFFGNIFGIQINSLFMYLPVSFVSIVFYSRFLLKKTQKVLISILVVAIIVLFGILQDARITSFLIFSDGSFGVLVFFLVIYLPIFLMATEINCSLFIKRSYLLSLITLSFYIACFILTIIVSKNNRIDDYMTFAYYSVPSCFFLAFFLKTNKSKKSFFAVAILLASCVVTFLGGCRGALLCLVCFFSLLFLIKSDKKIHLKRIIIIALQIVTAIIVLINIKQIAKTVSDLLQTFGYQSRVFDVLMGDSFLDTDSFFDSSGRIDIWTEIISNINLFGHGLVSDRILLDGTYPHNFFLEIAYQFGLVAGIMLSLFLIFRFFYVFRVSIKYNSLDLKFMLISFFSILIVKMMISSSYLLSLEFWLFLGMLTNKFKYIKKSNVRLCYDCL